MSKHQQCNAEKSLSIGCLTPTGISFLLPTPRASRSAWQCPRELQLLCGESWRACPGIPALLLAHFPTAGEPWRMWRCFLLLRGQSWALSTLTAYRCGISLQSNIRAFFYSTGRIRPNYLYLLQRFGVICFLFSSCVLPEFLSGRSYS